VYQQVGFDPFVANLDQLGEANFNKIVIHNPKREGTAGLMLDIAQALLQRGRSSRRKRSGRLRKWRATCTTVSSALPPLLPTITISPPRPRPGTQPAAR
jgi:hypothetical protein